MDLGQIVNGTPNVQEYEADWAEYGLRTICEIIGQDSCYAVEYENDVFETHPYWWGDDDRPEAERANFIYKKTGLKISWYKRIGKGMSGPEKPNDWHRIVAECLMSIPVENRKN